MPEHAAVLSSNPSRLAWGNDSVYILASNVDVGIEMLMLAIGIRETETSKDVMTISPGPVLCLQVSHLSVYLHLHSSITQFLIYLPVSWRYEYTFLCIYVPAKTHVCEYVLGLFWVTGGNFQS